MLLFKTAAVHSIRDFKKATVAALPLSVLLPLLNDINEISFNINNNKCTRKMFNKTDSQFIFICLASFGSYQFMLCTMTHNNSPPNGTRDSY